MSDNEHFADPTEIRHVIGAAGTFSLHNVSGDIEIRGADTDEVRVVASSSHGSSDSLPLIVRRGEGSLHIQIENMGPAPDHGSRLQERRFRDRAAARRQRPDQRHQLRHRSCRTDRRADIQVGLG